MQKPSLRSTASSSSTYELLSRASEPQQVRTRLRETGWWSKIVLLAIIIPTVISIVIGGLHLRHYKTSGSLYHWSITSRALLQVVVHILSSLLSVLWMYPICKIISHSTRHRLSKKAVDLNTLRLWSAIVQARTDWNLPTSAALMALGFFALTYLPATIWAGALTPTFTVGLERDVPLQIPSSGPLGNYSFLYPPPTKGGYLAFNDCWVTQQANGTFTNCPLKYHTRSLLLSVASASSPDNNPRNHSKWDNAKFQYVGRSYGVGASTGLTDHDIITLDRAQEYTYNEVGFVTNTNCIYNATSDWIITWAYDAPNGAYPNMWTAVGALPNSNWTAINSSAQVGDRDYSDGRGYYAQVGFGDGEGIVSVTNAGPLMPGDDRYFFALAAGSSYAQLDKVQCQLTFEPANFRVDVSIANNTITVTRDNTTKVENLDPDKKLRMRAIDQLGVSFIEGSLYVSTVGDAFMENARNLQIRQELSPTANITNATILAAVADSVTAMMDDTFVALASAGLTVADVPQTVGVNVTMAAVQIGTGPFILAIALINIGGCLVVLAGSVLLFNAHVPQFDYNDLACVAIGTFHGAKGEGPHFAQDGDVSAWDGDPADSHIGHLLARLETSVSLGQPTLMLTRK
ncbi:hypothetical protein BDV96DRAFT_581523 [Lophiotrema nucula]|uniref:Uncharacterized protein n=1 Tax=Lophiotrema nucula TaxID=690887 RepID=A0A6A5Z003_9PLEO|nr:hypothetical protein BDV96DRAFT_581523 [Lophiotrema nucula]